MYKFLTTSISGLPISPALFVQQLKKKKDSHGSKENMI